MDPYDIPKKVNRHVIKAVNNLSTGLNNTISTGSIINEVKYQMRNLVPVRDVDMMIRRSLWNLSYFGIITKVAHNMYSKTCLDSKSNQNQNPQTQNPQTQNPQTQIEEQDQQLKQTQSENLSQPDCQQLRQPQREPQRQTQRQLQRQTKRQPLKQSYPQCKRRKQSQRQKRPTQKRRQRQAQPHRKPVRQPARPLPNQPPLSQQQNQTNAFLRYFEPRRPINEKSTESLNPNKRKRSLISVSSSLSGDEIEKTRKRFCTQKTLRRAGNFAHLPHSCKHQNKNARNSLNSQQISELSINTGFSSRIHSSLQLKPSTHVMYTSTTSIVESTSMLVQNENETSVSLNQINEKCPSTNLRSNLLNMSSDSSINNNLNPLSSKSDPNVNETDSSELIGYSYAVEYSIKEKNEEKIDEQKEEKIDEKKEERIDEQKEDDKDKC